MDGAGSASPHKLRNKASISSLLKLGSPRKIPQPFGADENISPAAVEPSVGFVKGLLGRVSSSSHGSQAAKRSKQAEEDREPFRSYLRIRPASVHRPHVHSFAEVLSDTEIRLHAPDNAATNGILGMRSTPGLLPASNFSFTRVCGASTSQTDFFRESALPLVQDVLDGTSGLLFAYGVSNSGKTYTVQGGPRTGEPGLLPRAVDVMFNSIRDKQSLANVRPARLDSVEAIPIYERTPHFATYLHDIDITAENKHKGENMAHDSTILPVADGFSYAVWVSYVEVYNEKIYDLLEAPEKQPAVPGQMPGSFSAMSLNTLAVTNPPAPTSQQLEAPAQSLHHKASSAELKRKALNLKHDKESGNKYISGATEVRVWSADDARAIMRKGQINRRVYGTMLNRTSSRSHGIFTIKIVRVPLQASAGGELAASSRLCIVDLAGSERTRNAQTSGERLKEAGNINKSLMVLGQCLEVIRQNQRRERTKKPQQVPFRHSKLTELFQSFFMGQGRAAMVVCLNPFDTGFEESLHVLKFSAMAKEVTTSAPTIAEALPVQEVLKPAPLPFQHPSAPPLVPLASPSAISRSDSVSPVKRGPLQPSRLARENTPEYRESTPAPESYVLAPEHRIITRESTPAPLRDSASAPDEAFVLAPEPESEVEDEDEQDDGFVDFLLDEIASLRVQLVEAEIEGAVKEAQVRQEVVRDFSERMRKLEDSHALRMQRMMDAAERKYDQKIAILQRAYDAMFEEKAWGESDGSEADDDDGSESEFDEEVSAPDAPEPKRSAASLKVADAKPVSHAAEVIDVDALSESGTATTSRPSSAMTAPEGTPERELAPPSKAAIKDLPEPPAKSLRKSTRKSNRKSAAATPAAAKGGDDVSPAQTPRKSRAPPVGVRDRIKALEAMFADDGEAADDPLMIIEAGKTTVRKKRKLVGKARNMEDLEDEEEVPANPRAARNGILRSQTSRTLRPGRT